MQALKTLLSDASTISAEATSKPARPTWDAILKIFEQIQARYPGRFALPPADEDVEAMVVEWMDVLDGFSDAMLRDGFAFHSRTGIHPPSPGAIRRAYDEMIEQQADDAARARQWDPKARDDFRRAGAEKASSEFVSKCLAEILAGSDRMRRAYDRARTEDKPEKEYALTSYGIGSYEAN